MQVMKNRAYYAGIKRTPYEAMFDGCSPEVGLSSSTLFEENYKGIITKEELDEI